MKRVLLIEGISAVLILLFGYTAISKLLGYEVFIAVLKETPVVEAYARWIGWMLPAVELAVALLLLVPKFRLQGLIAAFVLTLLLTAYLWWMVAFHRELPCNCGGVLQSLSWKEHIGFNLFFTVLAMAGVVLVSRQRQARKRSLPN